MLLQECAHYLHDYLNVESYKESASNGIQVEGKKEIRRLGFAVTASRYVIEQAIASDVDALIVHHGFFWGHIVRDVTGPLKNRLKALLSHDISLLAYHLPLDGHKELGNNWKAALDLGWYNLEPFGVYGHSFIGVKGCCREITREDFQEQLEHYYQRRANVALGGSQVIRCCALISGGAYKQIGEAAQAGVDAFITGNCDEPAWHDAWEYGINFFSLGHHATERVGVVALMNHLKNVFSLEVVFFDENNPF